MGYLNTNRACVDFLHNLTKYQIPVKASVKRSMGATRNFQADLDNQAVLQP